MQRKIAEIFGKIIEFTLIVLMGALILMFIYGIFNFFRFFFLLKDYLGIN